MVQAATDASMFSLSALRDSYLSAVLHGDRRRAVQLVIETGLAHGVSVQELASGVVQETQREIGRLWQENTIGIAQEHQATAISQAVLARLYDAAPLAPQNGKRVLVACVEGEQHDFPARLVSDRLDLSGFDTLFLGANVPTESLVERVRAEQPDLVALSVTMAFNVPALRTAVAAVRAARTVPIAIGGGACAWVSNVAEELKIEISATSAEDFVRAASVYLGVSA